MKNIILIRHGEAKEKSKNGFDFTRELTKKGIKDVHLLGNSIARNAEPGKKIIITSKAYRAYHTALLLGKLLDIERSNIEGNDQFYTNMPSGNFINMISKFNNEIQTVLIVGHNPWLENLSASLISEFKGKLPKASAFAINLNINQWSEAQKEMMVFRYLKVIIINHNGISKAYSNLFNNRKELLSKEIKNMMDDEGLFSTQDKEKEMQKIIKKFVKKQLNRTDVFTMKSLEEIAGQINENRLLDQKKAVEQLKNGNRKKKAPQEGKPS